MKWIADLKIYSRILSPLFLSCLNPPSFLHILPLSCTSQALYHQYAPFLLMGGIALLVLYLKFFW
jgi:hypothetical protein